MEREERNISKRWRDVFIYDRMREEHRGGCDWR